MNIQILNPLEAPKTAYETWRWAEDLFEARDYYGAARLLEELLAHDDADPRHLAQARELLARSYYHSAQVTKAIEVTESALAEEPGNGYLVLLLGRALQRAGRRDEAEPHLRMARALGIG